MGKHVKKVSFQDDLEKFIKTTARPEEIRLQDNLPAIEDMLDSAPPVKKEYIDKMKEYDEDPSRLPWGPMKSFFIQGFFTPEMEKDFPFIVKDLFRGQMEELPLYMNAESDTVLLDCPDTVPRIGQEVLRGLVDMAFDGNKPAKDMLIGLYKTYYKKEYMSLKKFTLFDGTKDILAFTQDAMAMDSPPLPETEVSRLMVFLRLMGIEMTYVGYIFFFIEKRFDALKEEKKEDRTTSVTLLPKKADCEEFVETVKHLFDKDDIGYVCEKLDLFLDYFYEAASFFGMAGSYDQYADMYTEHIFYKYAPMAVKLYGDIGGDPDDLSEEDILHMTAFLYALSILSEKFSTVSTALEMALGIGEDFYTGAAMPKYRPNPAFSRKVSEKKEDVSKESAKDLPKEPLTDEKEKEYIERIAELEGRLRDKERTIQDMQAIHEEQRSRINALEKDAAGIEQDREELARFREFAANLDIEEDPLWVNQPPVDIETMKEAIKRKKIAIIGGNQNWRKKLQGLFPRWTFVYSHNYPVYFVKSAEHIFFFTDSLAHDLYYKYIAEAKAKNIPYSIIHGVDLSGNIRYIYEKTAEKGN